MNKPELLSPAGLIKNMRFAFAYGADAVYAGLPRYSLRVRNNDFKLPNLEAGINEAHALEGMMPEQAVLQEVVNAARA